MKKLRLEVERLRVDRFETRAGAEKDGTVVGQGTGATWCDVDTCWPQSCVTVGPPYPCGVCP